MNATEHCGPYIKQLHDALERIANNSLHGKDLTLVQARTLAILCSFEDAELPLKELEKRMSVSQATAAGVVRRLEQKRFVLGYTSSEDRRVKCVRATDSGKAALASAEVDVERTERQLMNGLTAKECTVFISLLRRVSRNFE
jgi:DNA-binding MarR family transcriptional regulator